MNGNGHRAVDVGASTGKLHSHLAAPTMAVIESTPLHLLVVDDDEHIRGVCRTVAESSGMSVMDVSTAEEAIELLEVSAI